MDLTLIMALPVGLKVIFGMALAGCFFVIVLPLLQIVAIIMLKISAIVFSPLSRYL